MSRDPASPGSVDSRTADFDLRENSFRKSFSACFRASIVPFISRNCAETSDNRSCIRWYSTARTDTETTKAVPVRNRQTDAATATTGTRMLTGVVRLWGTSRMVTGVRILFRNIRARCIVTSFQDEPDGGKADTFRRGYACNRHSQKGLR